MQADTQNELLRGADELTGKEQQAAPTPKRASLTGVTRDPERTRAAILKAAIDEFAENGLGGARIDAIAARAGSNKRMIYHYFGGKDQLFMRALQELYQDIRKAERELALSDLEPVAAIRELCRFTWRYFVETPAFLSLLATENLNRGAYLNRAEWRRDVNAPIINEISAVLSRGVASGVFRPGCDPIDVYVTMAGIGYFYLSNKYTLSAAFDRDFLDPQQLDRWGDHIAETTLAYLRA